MTWRSDFAEIIADETRDLPNDMPLDERIRFIDGVRTKALSCRDCSWGRKAWQAARRDYLIPFGYDPKTKKAKARRESVVADLPLFEGGFPE